MYCWKVKDGKTLNVPEDKFNHFWDSVRYALSEKTGLNNKITHTSNVSDYTKTNTIYING